MKVAVIGLGQMGGNMARTLASAGLQVTGLDPIEASRKQLEADGIAVVAPDAPLPQADVYLLSLPSSAQVETVVLQTPNLLRHAPAGSVVMDASTSDPASTKVMAQKVLQAGLQWLDAPVSGGPAGAANGTLGMLLGGDAATITRVQPVLNALASKTTHVGGPGSGHVVKLANNFLCATNLVAVAQAVAMASHAGVEPQDCLAGINSGSGRSAVSEVNFPKWVLSNTFDSGFTMGLMRKDLRLAADAAKAVGLDPDMVDMVSSIWQANTDTLADASDFNQIVTQFLSGSRSGEAST